MFFIMGIDPRQKLLQYNSSVFICEQCQNYGRYEVYLTYMCFSLFFIPLFKWNKTYHVRTTCCGATYELDPAIGQAIASGKDVQILPEHLKRTSYGQQSGKRCTQCGFVTNEPYTYCPNCGKPFEY